MLFKYNKLRGRIVEIFGTQKAFAQAMGQSVAVMSSRLQNKTEWTQREINKAADLLNIEDRDISLYFFTPKVQKSEQREANL